MDRPRLEVADVFRRHGSDYRLQHGASMSMAQRRVMTAIEVCRTAVLGGHLEQCDHCGHQRNAYNSWRGSPLPKMPVLRPGSMARGSPIPALGHPVLPRGLHCTRTDCNNCHQNKRELYGILFRATAQTLFTIAADPKHLGAEIGFFAVLHTWGQNLFHHPHLHCVVPGGGLSAQWQPMDCLPGWIFPVRAGALKAVSSSLPGKIGQRL